jgi:hypothetical protein
MIFVLFQKVVLVLDILYISMKFLSVFDLLDQFLSLREPSLPQQN